MKKAIYIVFAVIFVFPWISQALFPRENIWEPIGFNIATVLLFFIIMKWGKP